MEKLLGKKALIDRSYSIALYDPEDEDKVVGKMTVGELINLVSTFAVGSIVKELKTLREQVDKKTTKKDGGCIPPEHYW